MTAVLVALALTAGTALGWWARGQRDGTRALDAHLSAVKADVFAESGERLYDEHQAYLERVNPELTRLQGINARLWALRGRRTA